MQHRDHHNALLCLFSLLNCSSACWIVVNNNDERYVTFIIIVLVVYVIVVLFLVRVSPMALVVSNGCPKQNRHAIGLNWTWLITSTRIVSCVVRRLVTLQPVLGPLSFWLIQVLHCRFLNIVFYQAALIVDGVLWLLFMMYGFYFE